MKESLWSRTLKFTPQRKDRMQQALGFEHDMQDVDQTFDGTIANAAFAFHATLTLLCKLHLLN
jgi:hypothetical protein